MLTLPCGGTSYLRMYRHNPLSGVYLISRRLNFGLLVGEIPQQRVYTTWKSLGHIYNHALRHLNRVLDASMGKMSCMSLVYGS